MVLGEDKFVSFSRSREKLIKSVKNIYEDQIRWTHSRSL